MNTIDIDRVYTPADLLRLPDNSGYELVDGRLVDVLHDAIAGWIACQISAKLLAFVQKHSAGIVLGSKAQYQCFPQHPQRIRKAHISFVDRGKLRDDFFAADFIQVVPDLVIEVISAHKRYCEVEAKVREFLNAGVRLIWVLNPQMKTVRVHRISGPLREIDCGGVLDGEDVIPGFSIAVTPLFELPPMVDD